ncbi:MAG: CvpA family protein [Spirochaetaceae bacterium]|nr:CvpA family protein [Spirochaetaceae bacterium]
MEFNAIDVVFAVLILLLMVRCLIRGFIGEVFSMAQWVLGLGAAFLLYRRGAVWLAENYFPGQKFLPNVLAFAGIFIVIFIFILILEKILKDIVTGVQMGGADRILGALFGLAEGLLFVSLILWLLEIQPLFDSRRLIEGSFFYSFLSPFIGSVEATVAEAVGAVSLERPSWGPRV